MTVARSLLMKLALLMVTAGLVLWIGWPVPRAAVEAPTDRLRDAEGAAQPTKARGSPAGGQTSAEVEAEHRAEGARLDLNRAQAGELAALPGIGAGLARRIVEHREQVGRFRSVEELESVKGIGRKRLERLRPLVMVKDPQPGGRQPG